MRSGKDYEHVEDGGGVVSIQQSQRLRAPISEQFVVGTLEALLGIILITVVGFVVPGHRGLLDLQPHPLWIVVIAIAIRYGAASGYIAGALAAASYTLFLCIQPGLTVRPPPPHDLLQPLLLLTGGIIAGELARSQHRRYEATKQRYLDTQAALREHTQHEEALAAVNAEFEKRIVSQSSSLLTLYDVAKKLNVLCVDAIYPAILDVVAEMLEPESCALYLWHAEQLALYAGSPQSLPGRKETCDVTTGVIGRAFSDGRVVTVQDCLVEEGAQAIGDEPAVMAGPLMNRDGRPLGVVVIERLPFLKLNPANIRMFEALLEWSSTALENAHKYEEMRAAALALWRSMLPRRGYVQGDVDRRAANWRWRYNAGPFLESTDGAPHADRTPRTGTF